MLFFFRRVDVPDGSQLSFNVTGDTNAVGLSGTLSIDGGPKTSFDPTQQLPLRSPHDYAVDFDAVTLQQATVTIEVEVLTPDGTPYGSPFSQQVTGQPGDLNTVSCALSTAF